MWGYSSFPLGSGAHKLLSVPSKCLFQWKFCSKSHWTSQSNSLGSQFLCWIPRLGNLLWALELLQQCKNFFGVIVLQFVGCPLCGSVVGLMVTSSKRTYATRCTSQVCCNQRPCPRGRPLLTQPLQETLKHSEAGLAQSLWGPWVLVHTRFCLSPPSISGG